LWGPGFAEGRAPHARDGTIASPRHVPGWPPRHRQPSGGNEIPWPAFGLPTRARRPRPSEKTTLPVIPGFSPQGHPSSDSPPRKGAGSARPHGNALASPWYAPARPPGVGLPLTIMPYPAFASGLATRARRPRPSEKTPLRAISGPSPQGHLTLAHPPGGAGSARPRGRHNANRNVPPFGHRPLSNSSVITTCLGSPPAFPPGRGDRAPPRKPPLAPSPALTPLGHPSCAHPLGGAGSARPR